MSKVTVHTFQSRAKTGQDEACNHGSKPQHQQSSGKYRKTRGLRRKTAILCSTKPGTTHSSIVGKRKRREGAKSLIGPTSNKRGGSDPGFALPPLSPIPFPFDPCSKRVSTFQGTMKLETLAFATPETLRLPSLRELLDKSHLMPISELQAAQKAPRRLSESSPLKTYNLRKWCDSSVQTETAPPKSLRRQHIPTTVNSLIAWNKELARENLKLRAELVLAYRNELASCKDSLGLRQSSNSLKEYEQTFKLPKVSTATELCRLASVLSSLQLKDLPRDVLHCRHSLGQANPFILCVKQGFDFIFTQMRCSDLGPDRHARQSMCTVFHDVHLEILTVLLKSKEEDARILFDKVFRALLCHIKRVYESILDDQDGIDVAWSRAVSEGIVNELQKTLQTFLPSVKRIEQLRQVLLEVLQEIASGLRDKAKCISSVFLRNAVELSMTIAIISPEVPSMLSGNDALTIARYNPLFCQAGIADVIHPCALARLGIGNRNTAGACTSRAGDTHEVP